MIKAITINGSIRIGIPKFWVLQDGTHDHAFNTRSDEVHFSEGWKEVVTPPINHETQRLGAIFERENDFTYPIIDKSEEELIQEAKNVKLSEEEKILEKLAREELIDKVQAKEGSEALAVKYAYPLWEMDILCKLNNKYTYIEADKTISLYKCLIQHVVDGTRLPPASVTYFTKVTESIIPWTAGITALKDRLYSFGGKNYRCLETHVTVAGQDPTKAKAYWVEEKL